MISKNKIKFKQSVMENDKKKFPEKGAVQMRNRQFDKTKNNKWEKWSEIEIV